MYRQIRFRLGLCPRTRWGAYSAPPDSLAGFKGPTSKGGEGKDKEGRPVFSVQFVGKPTRVTSLEGDDDEIAYFSVR